MVMMKRNACWKTKLYKTLPLLNVYIFKKMQSFISVCMCCNENEDLEGHLITCWQVSLYAVTETQTMEKGYNDFIAAICFHIDNTFP